MEAKLSLRPGVSLWSDTLPDELTGQLGAQLPGDTSADIVIVGAGYTGLWSAYYLLQQDPTLRVVILEAQHAGFGASGRNGGWASALFPVSLAALARQSSRDAAIRQKRAMNGVVAEIGEVAARENWQVDWHQGGTITLARTPLQWQDAQQEVADLRAWGFGEEDLALLGRDEALARVNATDVHGATFTPHCAAMHPGRLVQHLARTVVARGAVVHEHTPVTRIEPGAAHTPYGIVRAEVIIRATEAYTRTLAGHRRTLAPVYSLMIATEPLSDDLLDEIGMADRPTFSDGRHLIIYGQRTADGRLAFGGRGAPYHFGSRISPSQDVNHAVHTAIRQSLVALFPSLASTAITHEWGGPIGIARDWWASCGFDRGTGLAWAGGYVGDGVGTSNLAGRTLADLITDRQSDLVTLPWVGHRSRRWEVEPLRWLGTNIGLRVITSADEVEARTGKPTRRAAIVGRSLGH